MIIAVFLFYVAWASVWGREIFMLCICCLLFLCALRATRECVCVCLWGFFYFVLGVSRNAYKSQADSRWIYAAMLRFVVANGIQFVLVLVVVVVADILNIETNKLPLDFVLLLWSDTSYLLSGDWKARKEKPQKAAPGNFN